MISIDPAAEFAPGMRYVDYVAVEVSPDLVQVVPEPAPVATILAGLVFLAARRRRVGIRASP